MKKVVVHIENKVPVEALRRLGANRQLMLVDYNHSTGCVTFCDTADGWRLGVRLASLQRSLRHVKAMPMFDEAADGLIRATL